MSSNAREKRQHDRQQRSFAWHAAVSSPSSSKLPVLYIPVEKIMYAVLASGRTTDKFPGTG